ADLHRRPDPEPPGDGRDRHFLVYGQSPAHPGVQHDASREHQAGGNRSPHRDPGSRRVVVMTGEVLDSLRQEMDKTPSAFKKELSHVRTGRASTALLEGITVDYYGAKTPLNQVSTLSAPEPTLLVVQPFDKTVIAAIEKAIKSS